MDKKKELVLKRLLTHAVIYHPMPWHIDRDWAYDVRAQDNTLVTKCRSEEEAQTVIDMARDFQIELDQHREQTETDMETYAPV